MKITELRSRTFQDANPHLMGIIAGVVLGAAVLFAFSIGSLGLLDDTYTVSGVFRDVTGLKVGGVVRVAGVEVGRVERIEPDFELGQVVVTWGVDSTVDLGPQTTATLAVNNLLGGYHLRLEGPVEQPYLATMEVEERRITLERTAESFKVLEALDATTRGIEDLDVDLVNAVLSQFADLAAENGTTVASVLERLDDVSRTIEQREDELAQLLDDSRTLTDTLSAKDAELVRLAQAARSLLGELVLRRDDLAAALGDGADAVTALSDLVDGSRQNLDALLGDLTVVLDATDRQQQAVHEALILIGPTFENVGEVGGQGPWLDFLLYSFMGNDA